MLGVMDCVPKYIINLPSTVTIFPFVPTIAEDFEYVK